jgi:hypothetical protein
MDHKPIYPTILRQADWNTKKGVIAKLFKEDTGLGNQLAQLYAAYGKVEWQYWFPQLPGSLPAILAESDLDKRIPLAKAKRMQLINVAKAAEKISDQCETIGAKWAKSKVVPDGTLKHVRVKMAAAADTLADELRQVAEDDHWDDFRAHIRKYDADQKAANDKLMQQGQARKREIAVTNLNLHIEALERLLPPVRKNPTVDNYNGKFWDDGLRGVGTSLANMPALSKVYERDWEDRANHQLHDDEEVAEHLDEIEAAIARLKRAIKQF